MEIKEIVTDLKQKKELKDMDDSFVEHRVLDYIEKNDLKEKLSKENFKKSSSYEKMFKELRKQLREVYGVFRGESFTKNFSTKERLLYYKEIYHKIFEITGNPKSILDLGCGLNPLSYKYLGCKPKYDACDISKDDLKQVNDYFKKNKIKGKVFLFNLVDDSCKDLPTVDVCFLFKTLESLEEIKKNISEKIIKELKCDWIVVSFSKKSLSGKRIRKAGRSWFRKILKKLGLYSTIFDIGDEIFFIVKKS